MNQPDPNFDRPDAVAPASCFVPRGDARLLAMVLKREVLRRRLDASAITAAVVLAGTVHRHQRRTGDGSPYLTHPLQVAALVCRWGGSSDDVIAAVLHDAAEDHVGGPREMLNHISDLFSTGIADRVSALTKNTTLPDRDARAWDLMDRLDQAMACHGLGVVAVRVADRLHNAVTSGHLPPENLARLNRHTQGFVTPLARRLGLDGVARFLAGGPQAWAQVPANGFLGAMSELQRPWLPALQAQSHATPEACAM